jgi:hypothetical protein
MSPMCDVCLMLPIEVSRPPAGQRNMLTLCLTDPEWRIRPVGRR